MDIRQLRYVVALARERHFARAADACCVSQPTLSGRIRQLEQELDTQIVQRGRRYEGLTPEGEKLLAWARRILEDCDGMRDELATLAGAPTGRLTIGAAPSTLPALPPLTEALRARFPQLGVTLLSLSSTAIARQLETFAVDAGVTYLDDAPASLGARLPLYLERYRLFVRDDHPLALRRAVGWAEAAEHPLCALTPEMRNRRITDAAFRAAGAAPAPAIESNSAIELCIHVRAGGLACVLPECFAGLVGGDGVLAIPLVAPEIEQPVGLVALERDPMPPLVAALIAAARDYAPSTTSIGSDL